MRLRDMHVGLVFGVQYMLMCFVFTVHVRCLPRLRDAQVEEVVKLFPDEMMPVLVKAATGAAVSDYLRVEAFELVGGVLQRWVRFDVL